VVGVKTVAHWLQFSTLGNRATVKNGKKAASSTPIRSTWTVGDWKAGVTFENTSATESLVVLRYFGPEVNPDAPALKYRGDVKL